MSDRGKQNAILLLQLLTLGGLVYAYFQVAPLLDKANSTLDKANQIEDKFNHLI